MDKYEVFKKQIYKLTNIDLGSYKEKQMKRRINSLIKRNNFRNYDNYFKALKNDNNLLDEFLNYLTINVSEFFRNPEQWKVLEDYILPKLIKSKGKNIKVWSSACSTGEEPYTLVMILSKYLNLQDVKVLATDIDNNAINNAKVGVYDEKSLKNVPSNFKSKYFTKLGRKFKIDNSIKQCVKFKKHNLLEDDYPTNLDLIICRNVMIYFTEEAKNKLYKKFNKSLADDGIFFVGSTEQIILPERYNFRPIKTFFYKKVK
ncbi:CheR family methyltransferase [Thermohalobacter berrensis]|uniref:protein-glutamate O-methyltransferase n=1 Tax=Thermohalobacter berrensis TaxID=99594 RepID=A0A419TBD2_9FIRM|nr:protein-glutamate O-methyltransferase CheR [Thermohalobacter berrensis]RKD34771.1 chemotaxis protein CheR [Thermohalobacter berrensis]